MKFALINNQRQEATPKTKGICPVCKMPVISKCGKINAPHWAHETKQDCKNDRWEKEGEWHQKWKNQFPKEWQEQIVEVNGKKNIADIKTPKGLVIEFQHSHIEPEEQRARENNYKNMIWVVDGTRLKYDFSRFKKNVGDYSFDFLKIRKNIAIYSITFYDEVLPKNWLNSSVPVIFDFSGLEEESNATIFQKYLYCLLPIKTTSIPKVDLQLDDKAFLFYFPRKDFIPFILNNEWTSFYSKLLLDIGNKKIEIKKQWEETEAMLEKERQKDLDRYYNKIYTDKYGFKKKLRDLLDST